MEIFKIVIPAFIVMMTAYLLLDKMLVNEDKRRKAEFLKKNHSVITPVRLRAYERLALLLERTHPSAMMLQVIQPGMTCIEAQSKLLSHIRAEFDHNLSQQIYVSTEVWDAVKATHDNLIKIINTTAQHFQPDEPATKYAEVIIRMYTEPDENPTSVALALLKNETQQLFLQG
ncbi:MAG: hypothetical protein RBT57_05715 [Paludibacter sp.]|jgi:hypothetical protein|nr:hypothetical protein [Paludibacter sp.]